MLPGTYEARSLDTGATAVVELEGYPGGRLKREAIVAFVADYWARRGWAPSLTEVAAAAGLARPSAVRYHLAFLVADGRVAVDYHRPRSLRVVQR